MELHWAPYMEWAKKRPDVTYDLAGSNLLGCTVEELPGSREVLELNGSNSEGWPPLVESIAQHYGVTPPHVASATGAGGANFLAMAALLRAGDDVLIERPAYDPFLGAARLLGANLRRFDRVFEEGWALDPERVRAALTPRTKLIVITSPHNPSGALADVAALRAVGEHAARVGARVLVDEAYLDAVYAARPSPAVTLDPVFLSANSLTKGYGLSGLRCGWIIAEPAVAEAVRRARDVMEGSGSFPSDRLAVLAFAQLARLEARARSILEPNLRLLSAFVDAHGSLAWVQPRGGNVAFPRVAGVTDTTPLADRLQQEFDTAIVPGSFFEAPAHFRIAFGCRTETLRAGLERLARVLPVTDN